MNNLRMVSLSKIGHVRKLNEDRYLLDSEKHIYMVADGMGGHKRGEVAAQMGIDLTHKILQEDLSINNSPKAIEKIILKALNHANQKIVAFAGTHPDHLGMGTTLSLIYLQASQCFYGHIGDSRIYKFEPRTWVQISNDHTMVRELLDTGTISQEQAKSHPKKHVLIKALGTESKIEPDIGYVSFNEDDTIILMTDGVYEYIDEKLLAHWLANEDLEKMLELIDERISQAGAKDNYTLILVRKEKVVSCPK